MRKRASNDGISIHAISGSHAVLLAMDANDQAQKGLLGFAIIEQAAGSDQGRWLRGFKFFEETVPDPQPGERRSTLEHPIQSFLWGDYSVEPDTEYQYIIRPVYGTPANLEYGSDVTVTVRTEPTETGTHSVFFNRGAIPSQKFADLFGNRPPADQNDPDAEDVKWLSRGLLEAALAFIGQARGPRFALRVAAYEFSYPPILNALAAAAASGADVRIVYEDGQFKEHGVLKNTSTTNMNREAIRDSNIENQSNLTLIPRRNRRGIPHNKFIILLENAHPVQVWTGSTNFTPSGFLGQTNVGHIVRAEAVARQYLAYWTELSGDPEAETFQTWCSDNTPFPGDTLPPVGITSIFSPRQRSKMLGWYGDRIEGAAQTVMLTAAFGVTRKLAERFDNDRDFLRFLLMESKNRSAETQAMLERDRDTRIALGTSLNKDAITFEMGGHRLDEWFRTEEHFRKKGHVFYVHTKIMMIDTMSEDPLVFSGSANFSPNSLLSNDENMLLIRGDTRVSDIYTVKFMRLFNHFYFRYIFQLLTTQGRNDPTKAAFLDPTDGWVARHFRAGTYHCRRRELFK
jgi:phosphatidylserine/phosphatidylglycerophosphate/cardiolipin synthase-like enzyme